MRGMRAAVRKKRSSDAIRWYGAGIRRARVGEGESGGGSVHDQR